MLDARRPIPSFGTGLWLCLLLSVALQCLLAGEFGSDATVTPDSASYIALARDLQRCARGETSTVGDLVRTPGYPLLILGAAASAGIDLTAIRAPIRDWTRTCDEARRLIRRVVLLQQLMGLLVPLLIYLTIHALTRAPATAPSARSPTRATCRRSATSSCC